MCDTVRDGMVLRGRGEPLCSWLPGEGGGAMFLVARIHPQVLTECVCLPLPLLHSPPPPQPPSTIFSLLSPPPASLLNTCVMSVHVPPSVCVTSACIHTYTRARALPHTHTNTHVHAHPERKRQRECYATGKLPLLMAVMEIL